MWGSNDKGQLGLPAAADVAAQSSVSLCLHTIILVLCHDIGALQLKVTLLKHLPLSRMVQLAP